MLKIFSCALLVGVLTASSWADTPPATDGTVSAAQVSESTPDHPSIGKRIADKMHSLGWTDATIVTVISALPIVELRGAIPVGIGLGMPWWEAFLIAVVGNMIPVPLIIWVLGPLSRWGMKFPAGKRFFDWLFARTRHKTAGIEKYETLGLAVFVAIPLPATGAWTGAMAAFVMGLSMRHALWSIFLGVVVAGAIMVVLSKLGWIGAVIFGIALLAMMVGSLQQMLKREKPGEKKLQS